jgi:hypothetical protein
MTFRTLFFSLQNPFKNDNNLYWLDLDACGVSLFSESESIPLDPSSLGELTEQLVGEDGVLLLQRTNFSLW